MTNIYTIVLFFIVIVSPSLISYTASNDLQDDHEIFMVVDEQTPTLGMDITKVDTQIQIGRFDIGKGKSLTLSRRVKGVKNCIGIYQPCGAADWCCEGLKCDGIIEGECLNDAFCRMRGQSCSAIRGCCQPATCDGYLDGTCV